MSIKDSKGPIISKIFYSIVINLIINTMFSTFSLFIMAFYFSIDLLIILNDKIRSFVLSF